MANRFKVADPGVGRRALAIALSALIAIGGVPTIAMAEAYDEVIDVLEDQSSPQAGDAQPEDDATPGGAVEASDPIDVEDGPSSDEAMEEAPPEEDVAEDAPPTDEPPVQTMAGETSLTAKEWLRPYAVYRATELTDVFEMGGYTFTDGWQCSLRYYGYWNNFRSEINYDLEELFSSVSFFVGGMGSGDQEATMTIELDGDTYQEVTVRRSSAPRRYTVPTAGVRHLRIRFASDNKEGTYAIADVDPVPVGTLPERDARTANWRWNVEPLSSNGLDQGAYAMCGHTYTDALRLYTNTWLGSPYVTFNLKGRYKTVGFDVGYHGFNGDVPAGNDAWNEDLTIVRDGQEEVHTLRWNAPPTHMELDVSGVTDLKFQLSKSAPEGTAYIIGGLTFVSDGIVTGLRLEEFGKTVRLDRTDWQAQLHAHVVPPDALDDGVVWTSSDESVATVDEDGRVTAVGNGEARVTAQTEAEGDGGPFKQSCTVRVTGLDPLPAPRNVTASVSDRGTATARFAPNDEAHGYVVRYSKANDFATYEEKALANNKIREEADGRSSCSWYFPSGGAAFGYVRVAAYYNVGKNKVVGKFCDPQEVTFAYRAARDGWCIPNQSYGFGIDYTVPFTAWLDTYGTREYSKLKFIFQLSTGAIDQATGKFGGICFGLSLLSAANYLGTVDLRNVYDKSGDGLAQYGWQYAVRGNDGKGYFSTMGNPRALAMLERAAVSQFSKEIKQAELNWSYDDLLDYLGDRSNTWPILVKMESVSMPHAILIYPPEAAPQSTANMSPSVYDPNTPQSGDRIDSPTSDYTWTSSLTLQKNGTLGLDSWSYSVRRGSRVLKSSGDIKGFAWVKNLRFYDVRKLGTEFFAKKLTMQGTVRTMWLDPSINTLDVMASGQTILQMLDGEVTNLAEGYDFAAMVGDGESGGAVRRLSLRGGKVTYTASAGTVALFGDDENSGSTVTSGAEPTVTYDQATGDVGVKGNRDGEAEVSLIIDASRNRTATVKVDLKQDDAVSIQPRGGDLVIESSRELPVDVEVTEGDERKADGTVVVPRGKTCINTLEDKVERKDLALAGQPTAKPLPKAGTTLKNKSARYKVKKAGKTVLYAGPVKKTVSKIAIPATVRLQGVTYKVVGINANACKGLKRLAKVTIGKNVTSVGKRAFYNCPKLRSVVIKSSRIKTIGSQAFRKAGSANYRRLTVKVPKKRLKAYRKLLAKAKLSAEAKVTK